MSENRNRKQQKSRLPFHRRAVMDLTRRSFPLQSPVGVRVDAGRSVASISH